MGISTDDLGENLYIAENHRLRLLNLKRNFVTTITTWSIPWGVQYDKECIYVTDASRFIWRVFMENDHFVKSDKFEGNGYLRGLAMDKTGNLLVTDSLNGRILSFDTKTHVSSLRRWAFILCQLV